MAVAAMSTMPAGPGGGQVRGRRAARQDEDRHLLGGVAAVAAVGAPAVVGADEDQPVLVAGGGAGADRVDEHADLAVGQRDRVPVLGPDRAVLVAGLVGVAEVDEERVGVGLAEVADGLRGGLTVGFRPAEVVAVDREARVDGGREDGAGVVGQLGQGEPVERGEGGQFGAHLFDPREE